MFDSLGHEGCKSFCYADDNVDQKKAKTEHEDEMEFQGLGLLGTVGEELSELKAKERDSYGEDKKTDQKDCEEELYFFEIFEKVFECLPKTDFCKGFQGFFFGVIIFV